MGKEHDQATPEEFWACIFLQFVSIPLSESLTDYCQKAF